MNLIEQLKVQGKLPHETIDQYVGRLEREREKALDALIECHLRIAEMEDELGWG